MTKLDMRRNDCTASYGRRSECAVRSSPLVSTVVDVEVLVEQVAEQASNICQLARAWFDLSGTLDEGWGSIVTGRKVYIPRHVHNRHTSAHFIHTSTQPFTPHQLYETISTSFFTNMPSVYLSMSDFYA